MGSISNKKPKAKQNQKAKNNISRRTPVDRVLQDLQKAGIEATVASKINKPMKFVSTGSLALNEAIGRPGYPCGLITELVGAASSGKSLLALIAEAVVTRRKKYVIHLDVEGNHETREQNEWRSLLGVDMEYVIQFNQHEYAEKIMEGTRQALRTLGDKCELVIIDSVSAFVPEKVVEKEVGQQTVAIQAKLLHEWFDKLRVDNRHAAILALNQFTSNIGSYGNPVTKGGGHAMKYDPHLSLQISSESIFTSESDTEGEIGRSFTIRVVKNKVAPAGKIAKCKFLRELGGFDVLSEIIEIAVNQGVIKKSAPYYYIGDKAINGRQKLEKFLRSRPKLLGKIIRKVSSIDPKELGIDE